MYIVVIITVLVVAAIAIALVVKNLLRIAGPNEVLVFSGFGYGSGSGQGPMEGSQETAEGSGEGGGGGGKTLSRPVAVVVATPDGVWVEPVYDITKVYMAAITAAGFMLAMLVRLARPWRAFSK